MVESHLPGKDNTEADLESKVARHQIEWPLDKVVFEAISNQLGSCEIALFARELMLS